jgi:exopolysaccharide production protein ExoZ
MRRLESLQVGRAAAVLSVVVFHLTGLSVEYQRGCFYSPWTQVLRAGVDVFFVISGVVMVITTYQRFEQPAAAKRFLIHRVSRIYPPYLCLTAILFVLWFLKPGAVNRSSGVDLFSSFTLWPSTTHLPLDPVGWTLSFEMMFYLVFLCMIVYLKKRQLPRTLVLWSIVALTGCVAIQLDSSGTLLSVFPSAAFLFTPYVLEFVAGCFIGLAFLKFPFVAGRSSVLISVAIFALEARVFQAANFDGSNQMNLRVLLFALPAALLVYGLLAWGRKRGGSLPVPRWLIRCGDMSYSIYLVHLPVMHFAYRYLWGLFNGTGARPLFLVATTGTAIAASVLFYKLVERPFSLWARIKLEEMFKVPPQTAAAPSAVPLHSA